MSFEYYDHSNSLFPNFSPSFPSSPVFEELGTANSVISNSEPENRINQTINDVARIETAPVEETRVRNSLNKCALHRLIQVEHKAKNSKEHVFISICFANGLNCPSAATIKKWFELFETANKHLKGEVGNEKHFELLQLIANKYEMLNNPICLCSFPMDSVFMLNKPQFVFGLQRLKPKLLVMVDCEKPENKKNFPIDFNRFTPLNFSKQEQLKVYPIDFKRILLVVNIHKISDNSEKLCFSRLYFIETSRNPNKCNVLDEKELKNPFNLQSIIFDQLDSKRFVLIGKTPKMGCVMIEAQLNKKSIFVNEKLAKPLPQNSSCHFLSGSKISGILYEKDNKGKTIYGYWEQNLNSAINATPKFQFEYDFDKEEAEIPDSTIYTWSKTICYTAVFCSNGLWDIYIFNLETRKCHILNVGYQRIFDIFIDKLRMLLILTSNAVYKISPTTNITERKVERKRKQVREAVARDRGRKKQKLEDLNNSLCKTLKELELMKSNLR